MAISLWKCTICLLWLFVTSYSVVRVQAGPLCLSCERVARAEDCMHVIKCDEHEKCYSQRQIGTNLEEFFTLGCVDKEICAQKDYAVFGLDLGSVVMGKRHVDMHPFSQDPKNMTSNIKVIEELQSRAARSIGSMPICMQCCGSNFCNENRCGSHRSNIDQRCFYCDDVLHPEDCQATTVCNVGYKCFVHQKPLNLLIDDRPRFRLGCLPSVQCEGVMNSYRNLGCAGCCTEAYCNYFECSNSSVTTAATATTTNIVPQGTSEAIVHGPRSGNYNGSVTLTCSGPAGSGYVWSFRTEGGSLPTGVVRDKETLTINNLNENTRGTYICSAIPPSGNIISTNMTVSINAQPVDVTSIDHPQGHIDNAELVVLTCHVTGWPLPTVEWFLQQSGQQKPTSQVTYSDNNRVVTIASFVSSEHAGTWTCKGNNSNPTSGIEYTDSEVVTLH